MPVNKDALNRIRIIDRMLANPLGNYTSEDILRAVNGACGIEQRTVSLRMIQKDIKAIDEQFGKKVIRTAGCGGRRIVRYEDQSQPIFTPKLSDDEALILHETLKALGSMEGLESLKWLESLRKRLNEKVEERAFPMISFSHNEQLLIQPNLLGKLFSVISRKVAISVIYKRFDADPTQIILSPYQLKQYNDRWFLLGCPLDNDIYPYNPDIIINLALDRIIDFDEQPEGYQDPGIDLKARFDEIVGVTNYSQVAVEEVVFAVAPTAIPYINTKPIHLTQMVYPEDEQTNLRQRYPALDKFTFYSIECRPNYELMSVLASFQDQIVVISPSNLVTKMRDSALQLERLYTTIN